jgi:hypothetical protein
MALQGKCTIRQILAATLSAFALLRFALFCSKLATTLSAFAAFFGVLRETVLRQIDQN